MWPKYASGEDASNRHIVKGKVGERAGVEYETVGACIESGAKKNLCILEDGKRVWLDSADFDFVRAA
jgi:hypothetical protein